MPSDSSVRDAVAWWRSAFAPVEQVGIGDDRIGPSGAAALGVEIGLGYSVVSSRVSRLVGAGLRSGVEDLADARATLLTLVATGHHVVVRTRDRPVVTMDARVADSETNDRSRFTESLVPFDGLRTQEDPARDPGRPGPAATVGRASGPTS